MTHPMNERVRNEASRGSAPHSSAAPRHSAASHRDAAPRHSAASHHSAAPNHSTASHRAAASRPSNGGRRRKQRTRRAMMIAAAALCLVAALGGVALLAISLLTREGSAKKMRPWLIIFELTAGTTLFFLYWKSMSPAVYISTTTVGLLLASAGIADIGRGLTRFRPVINDINETFEQCEELIETEDSINIPTKYK